MAEQVEIEVYVESNVDRLDERAVVRFLADALNTTVAEAADFLSFIVPRRTGEMASRVGHTDSHPEEEFLSAAVGIPKIGVLSGVSPAVKDLFAPGEQDSSDYPLFRDRGTGIFGPAGASIHARKVSVMRWIGDQGLPIFRAETKGSEGSHFMLATYAFTMVSLRAQMVQMDERIKHLPTVGAAL